MSEASDAVERLSVRSALAARRLAEAIVDSGRAAVEEYEEALARTEAGGVPDRSAVLDGAVDGYRAFFRELGRTAERIAEEYRSESGKLVRKREP